MKKIIFLGLMLFSSISSAQIANRCFAPQAVPQAVNPPNFVWTDVNDVNKFYVSQFSSLLVPAVQVSGFQAAARTSISQGTGISYNTATGVITNSAPDQAVALNQGNGITITGTYPNFTISSTMKRQETYSGTTNASGIYTITYPTAYANIPNVQFQIRGGLVTQTVRITSSTTTGCTLYVQNRVDVVGLLPSYVNVSGATVDVLVTAQ